MALFFGVKYPRCGNPIVLGTYTPADGNQLLIEVPPLEPVKCPNRECGHSASYGSDDVSILVRPRKSLWTLTGLAFMCIGVL